MAEKVFFIVFLIWSLPLSYYRSRFRKKVYQTNSWVINIRPVFLKELKGLFGNIYSNDAEYLKLRNFYRIYLAIYLLLLLVWQVAKYYHA